MEFNELAAEEKLLLPRLWRRLEKEEGRVAEEVEASLYFNSLLSPDYVDGCAGGW